jgi:aspartate beta-hydroxylase
VTLFPKFERFFFFISDDDDVKEQAPAPTISAKFESEDIQMHLQNDHGTGGHWCAKVVFFILMTVLGGLIVLIILENRGMSDGIE